MVLISLILMLISGHSFIRVDRGVIDLDQAPVLFVTLAGESTRRCGAAVESIAPKIDCMPQTLLEWVNRVEVGTGVCENKEIFAHVVWHTTPNLDIDQTTSMLPANWGNWTEIGGKLPP